MKQMKYASDLTDSEWELSFLKRIRIFVSLSGRGFKNF
jgi:hypothetical protein